jgi:hypothetical protein
MFDVYCPECSKTQLIFPSHITTISNDDGAIVVHFTCWCGAPGVWRTGSSVARERVTWRQPALVG